MTKNLMCTALLCAASAQGAVTTSNFQDFAALGGAFLDHPPTGVAQAPYGPFEITTNGVTTMIARDADYPSPGVWALGSMQGNTPGDFFAIDVDPDIDPGDWEGRWIIGSEQRLVLNIDPPARAFGASFKHFTCCRTRRDIGIILAYDGPNGTGNVIGMVDSGYESDDYGFFTDFVGIIDDTATIASIVIPGEDDINTFLDGIAIVPGSPTPPMCPGDANGDQMVNFLDLDLVLDNWNTTVDPGTNGDLSGDGFVSFEDLDAILGEWGETCG